MYDPECLNSAQGPVKTSKGQQAPTNLPATKKHNAVPPQSLNADPLVQIIGMETIGDVIIDDAKACALLDSGATTDLMSLAYSQA